MNAELELDPIVDAFDQQWQTGSRPQLTVYLERVSDSQRNQLARMLVPIDVEYRQQAGEAVDSTSDYGHLGQEIVELADSVVRGDASSIDQRHTKTSAAAFEKSVAETTTYEADSRRTPAQASSQQHPKTGQFGDYQVLNEIAEHGQGIVYRANHPRLHRQVVIKVCKKSRSAGNRQALLDEAKVLAQLSHPNVATVYDVQLDRTGNPYLVMEYIEGRNLADAIRESRPSVAEAVAMMKAVCDGLQHAHSFGILHLDLKPTNIVIRGSDRVPKIIDFGLAQLKPAYGTAESSSYGGTFRYMAPEQALGMKIRKLKELKQSNEDPRPLDARADVYALGAILYELLTGKQLRLSSDSQDKEVEQAIANEFDTEPLTRPGIPKELASICEQALATAVESRIGTAKELSDKLSIVGSDVPLKKKGILLGIGVGALLLAVLIGTSIIYSLGGSSKSEYPKPVVSCKVYRYEESNPQQPLERGILGDELISAQEDNRVRLMVNSEQPIYAFVIAFNPSPTPAEQIQLLYPESSDQLPLKLSSIEVPSSTELYFPLTDGIGQQAYVVVHSKDPLPTFEEWRSRFAEQLTWAQIDQTGMWSYSDGNLNPVFIKHAGRDRAPAVAMSPAHFKAKMNSLYDAVRKQGMHLDAIAFPVEKSQ